MDIQNVKEKLSKENLTDFSGKKKGKKTILAAVIMVLLGALGLEATNNDFDLGKLLKGDSLQEAKVLRDKDGNVVTDPAFGKATDEYNCADFATKPEAERFFENAGGTRGDTNSLDGDNDGEACEDLPSGN
ncbi:excalibur calcium-binding domain-containing protein [Candidatus Nomurabacteria bacterium]|nr:excalibur calcium-binding domain-containing protein [Candidatus Nomurabacteria bacterium]